LEILWYRDIQNIFLTIEDRIRVIVKRFFRASIMIKEKGKNFIYLFLFLFLVWLCLTSSLRIQEVLAGLVVSFILALVCNKFYLDLGLPSLSLKRLIYLIIYIAVLFKEIVKANLDVAYRILHPKMPIKPGIVTIKTGLRQDIAKLFLANSITLTPGTFTLDILGDNLVVHWINVKAEDIEEATKIIGEKFEKYLRILFE
jgi:multicomponent Na+:H+ antiporter subunit E